MPLLIALIALLPLPALADGAAAVKQAVESKIGGSVDAVRKTTYLGLYEVLIGDRLVYTDEKADYLFAGSIIDANTRANLTQTRLSQLAAIPFAELPLELAVKTVKGNGKRQLATFEDPNCGYCRRLAKELQELDNVTLYTFLLPILSADSEEKSKAVWCAADRAGAWKALMLMGTAPAAAACETPIDKIMAFARKHRIHGTPTIILANGERLAGAVPLAQLEKHMAQAQ
jgi:thiol:disulfide interchange protein DsbC